MAELTRQSSGSSPYIENATAVTLRPGQIVECTHQNRSIAMIVFHHSKCHVVLTGISTHDAVIWSCQVRGLMCRDSLTTASLLTERHHSVVNNKRMYTLCAHHCSGGMVISFKEDFLVHLSLDYTTKLKFMCTCINHIPDSRYKTNGLQKAIHRCDCHRQSANCQSGEITR